MNNWASTRLELDHILDLERALARQRRQQPWQRFSGHTKPGAAQWMRYPVYRPKRP